MPIAEKGSIGQFNLIHRECLRLPNKFLLRYIQEQFRHSSQLEVGHSEQWSACSLSCSSFTDTDPLATSRPRMTTSIPFSINSFANIHLSITVSFILKSPGPGFATFKAKQLSFGSIKHYRRPRLLPASMWHPRCVSYSPPNWSLESVCCPSVERKSVTIKMKPSASIKYVSSSSHLSFVIDQTLIIITHSKTSLISFWCITMLRHNVLSTSQAFPIWPAADIWALNRKLYQNGQASLWLPVLYEALRATEEGWNFNLYTWKNCSWLVFTFKLLAPLWSSCFWP